MSSPIVQLSLPSRDLFEFPPRSDPQTLHPSKDGSEHFQPLLYLFSPLSSYDSLDVRIPVTFSCIYAVAVTTLNAYNNSRGYQPWTISKTKTFFGLVVAHNVLLAAYSAWTSVGMLAALKRSVQNPNSPAGFVGMVDSLCKIHGASGLGNAIAYRPDLLSWVYEPSSNLTFVDNIPKAIGDRGRIWSEGLAFYGWLFYISKFYEVVDTAIILMKGKRAPFLQTYHHIGALMCMWAGIRYMSPPIWIPVVLNSAIHALMYTYYALTAFSVPVPRFLKKTLTTIQISQFIVSVVVCVSPLFIRYTISKDYLGIGASTDASSAIYREDHFPSVQRSGEAGGQIPALSSSEPNLDFHVEATECINTSGQAFAIWLSVLYLTPLTALFVRFFIYSYVKKRNHGEVKKAQNGGVERVDQE